MPIDPVQWARTYAATIEDASSLRNMADIAHRRLKANETDRTLCRQAGRVSLREWNRLTLPEDKELREAIRLCRAGLRRLGAPAWKPPAA